MHSACNLTEVERRCHHGVLMVDYCPLRLPLLSACRGQYETGGSGGRFINLFGVFSCFFRVVLP